MHNIALTLGTCERKELILGGHAAFGFLVERYGLRQVPLYDFSPNGRADTAQNGGNYNPGTGTPGPGYFF